MIVNVDLQAAFFGGLQCSLVGLLRMRSSGSHRCEESGVDYFHELVQLPCSCVHSSMLLGVKSSLDFRKTDFSFPTFANGG